jgi:hypothetical protein
MGGRPAVSFLEFETVQKENFLALTLVPFRDSS